MKRKNGIVEGDMAHRESELAIFGEAAAQSKGCGPHSTTLEWVLCVFGRTISTNTAPDCVSQAFSASAVQVA